MSHENIKNLVGVKESVEDLINKSSQDPSFGHFKYDVNTHWEGGVLCKASIRNEHELVVDEKPMLGGCDLGPSPVELILAALGTCQEIMYSVIASSMDIELEECDVKLTADLDIRGLLGVDMAEKVCPGFSNINYLTNIKTNASNEQLVALLDIVEKQCPVLDILTRQVPIANSIIINGQKFSSEEDAA